MEEHENDYVNFYPVEGPGWQFMSRTYSLDKRIEDLDRLIERPELMAFRIVACMVIYGEGPAWEWSEEYSKSFLTIFRRSMPKKSIRDELKRMVASMELIQRDYSRLEDPRAPDNG